MKVPNDYLTIIVRYEWNITGHLCIQTKRVTISLSVDVISLCGGTLNSFNNVKNTEYCGGSHTILVGLSVTNNIEQRTK